MDAGDPDGPKQHLCVKCGGDAEEVIPICTREVKAKRPRPAAVAAILADAEACMDRPRPDSPAAVAAILADAEVYMDRLMSDMYASHQAAADARAVLAVASQADQPPSDDAGESDDAAADALLAACFR
jgi:hypothetical protein